MNPIILDSRLRQVCRLSLKYSCSRNHFPVNETDLHDCLRHRLRVAWNRIPLTCGLLPACHSVWRSRIIDQNDQLRSLDQCSRRVLVVCRVGDWYYFVDLSKRVSKYTTSKFFGKNATLQARGGADRSRSGPDALLTITRGADPAAVASAASEQSTPIPRWRSSALSASSLAYTIPPHHLTSGFCSRWRESSCYFGSRWFDALSGVMGA